MKKYSIVAFLEGEDYTGIRETQTKIAELTGSRASMDSWKPHLTLGNGIECDDVGRDTIISKIAEIAKNHNKFNLDFNSFSGRTNRAGGVDEVTTPYVLWIDVVSDTFLENIVSDLDEATKDYKLWYTMPQPYIPHITLAFRDLTEAGHKIGSEYLETLSAKKHYTISNIALVEKKENIDDEYKRTYLG